MAGRKDEIDIDIDNIDLEKVIWDPRYRRAVIDRLNSAAGDAPASSEADPTRRKRSSG